MKQAGSKKPRLMRILGFALLAAAVFLVSVWLLFPYGEVEKRLVTELAKRGVDVEISGLGPVTPLTYRIRNLKVLRASGRELDLEAKDALVSLSLGKILSGRAGVTLEAKMLGGEVSAKAVVPNPENVGVAWKGVDLGRIVPLFYGREFPVEGTSAGSMTLAMPFETLSRVDATVEADFSSLSAGPVIMAGFSVGPVGLGSGRLRAEAQKGKVRIFDTSLSGGDFGAQAEGTISIGTPPSRSDLDLAVTLRPSQKAERDYMVPLTLISPLKRQDGSFFVKITGTPASPNVQAH